MNEDVQLFGGPYAHKPGDIVVAAQHRGLLIAELGEDSVDSVQTSEVLGLALVTLKDPRAAADALLARVREQAPEAGEPTRTATLDQVLWSLRTLIGAVSAGWSPTMGKNRLVGQTHGVGKVNHGGGGDPEPVDPPVSRAVRLGGPGRGVRVGVLDTGLYPQDWLAGGWAARFSDRVIDDDHELLYVDGHATFIAGLILGQAPGATVEVRRVLESTDDPETNGSADSWTVAEAIVEFGNSGLDVLNLSFVCYTEDGQPPLVLSKAIDRLPPDLVVVAAAGNHGAATRPDPEEGSADHQNPALKPGWPAALDHVIAVGAVTRAGELASFCPDAPWIDLLAEGEDLTSTYLQEARPDRGRKPVTFDGWARWSGTSFSAALVSGAVAASTEPTRSSAGSAMADILASLHRSSEKTVGHTGAKIIRLRTS